MATLESIWESYVDWLAEHARDAFENLAAPVDNEQLAEVERSIGQALPEELKALLRLNNGQKDLARCCALPGLVFLSAQQIAQHWQKWDDFRNGETAEGLEALDDYARALDAGVRDVYTHPGWLPLFKDGARADFVGLDLAPVGDGVAGQIINFGRDEDKHFIAFPNISGLIAFWLTEVKKGTCSVSAADPPDYPYAWFAHEKNSIDVLRRFCANRRATRP